MITYLNNYQMTAKQFACYQNEMYPFLALCEESGEVAGVIAKAMRKGQTLENLTVKQENDLFLELGDVLWQLSACCTALNFRLGDVATANISKLRERDSQGTLAETKR